MLCQLGHEPPVLRLQHSRREQPYADAGKERVERSLANSNLTARVILFAIFWDFGPRKSFSNNHLRFDMLIFRGGVSRAEITL